jgi:hypothetical protein
VLDANQQRLGTQSLGLFVKLFCFVEVSTGVGQLMANFHSLFSLLVSVVLLVLFVCFSFLPFFLSLFLLCFLCFQITFLEWVNFSLAAKRLKFYFDAI